MVRNCAKTTRIGATVATENLASATTIDFVGAVGGVGGVVW